jgi:hypothetical protein
MNILRKAILRLCWQEERYDRHAPRPWLRWFLTREVGIAVIPARKSERIQMAKKQWLVQRAGTPNRSRESLDPYGVEDLPEEYQLA